MITDQILRKIAQKHQTTELNIRREYCQHLFLSYFYLQKKTSTVYFKGGTALRILYQSPRFSEDLDFTAPKHDANSVEEAMIDTLAAMEKEGIRTKLKEAKTTTGGYLAIIEFLWNGYQIPIRLEISFREKAEKGDFAVISSDFLPPYTIVHVTRDKLVNGKISALFSRRKPRDFYDLYFLLRANLLEPSQRNLLREVPDLLKKMPIRFEKELKEFLPKSHLPVIRNFQRLLLEEIRRFR